MTPPLANAAAALALAALLSSCVSVLPDAKPAAPRYLLAPATFEVEGERVAWSLAVEDPLATRVYDTTKIALVRVPGRVEFLLGGEWADRATHLVQSAIVRSFENSGRILAVGDRIALPATDFVLHTDIRNMHATYESGAPVAKFSVHARLTDARGRVVAARLFEQSSDAAANSAPKIAEALDRAVTAALVDLVDWSFATAGAAYAK